MRPPGHHADYGSARGFCLFNNVALAAAYAIKKHRLERVAIVDFDVHHGNGTQSCFYNNPDVLYVSSHQSPLYPGTGDFSETGMDSGRIYVEFSFPKRPAIPLLYRSILKLLQPCSTSTPHKLFSYRPDLTATSRILWGAWT